MKRYFFILALLPLIPAGAHALDVSAGNSIDVDMLTEIVSEPDAVFAGDLWTYSLQPSHRSWLTGITALKDGDFLAVGTSVSPVMDSNAWLMRLKPYGETEWLRTLSHKDTWQQFNGVAASDSGRSGIAGVTAGDPEQSIDGWFVTVAPDGAVLNQKRYGGDHDDWFSAIASTPEGGFAVVGEYGGVDEQDHGWLLYLDADGQLLREHIFSMGERSWLSSLMVGAEGNVIAGGGVISEGKTGDWIVSLNPAREMIFSQTYFEGHVEASFEHTDGGPYFEQERSGGLGAIAMLDQGTLVAIGTSMDIHRPQASRDDRLVAFDLQGNKVWEILAEDGVIFAGLMADGDSLVAVGVYGQNAYAARFDPAGNMLSQQTFSGEGRQYFDSVALGATGNIVAIGASYGLEGARDAHGLAIGTYPDDFE